MMKIDKDTLIKILSLVLILSVSLLISRFYTNKVTTHFEKVKERSIYEHIKSKKSESEAWVNQLISELEHTNKNIDSEIKKELKVRLYKAHESAVYIYNKYKNKKSKRDIQQRIVDVLSQINYDNDKNHIFIRAFNGKSILSANEKFKKMDLLAYIDEDSRAIILEEVTKVRKRKEGYLRSRFTHGSGVEIAMVKNLGFFGWYIGTSIHESQQKDKNKHKMLEMIKATNIHKSDFIAIYDAKKSIYLSSKMQDVFSKKDNWHKGKVDGSFYYSKYFEPFGWHIVYGFNIFDINKKELQKQKDLELLLEQEIKFIYFISFLMILIISFMSIILFRSLSKTKLL